MNELLEDCQYGICCHNEEYQELKKELSQLEQQLQSYKQKEDKLRELIEAPIDNMSLNWQSKLILAILNEGSDKNDC